MQSSVQGNGHIKIQRETREREDKKHQYSNCVSIHPLYLLCVVKKQRRVYLFMAFVHSEYPIFLLLCLGYYNL